MEYFNLPAITLKTLQKAFEIYPLTRLPLETIACFPPAWMDSVYPRMSNKHNNLLLWDGGLRRNWRIDNK